uniref:Tc1-like transposase DDE domain-containing protein n=1 Tax=Acanthochromis polyacanthus TaxID=80966 RepID=A0A3Q1FD22_9TELE
MKPVWICLDQMGFVYQILNESHSVSKNLACWNFPTVTWPNMASDLNPTEHLWTILKGNYREICAGLIPFTPWRI